ncbi:MAG: DUF3343 domain-containing protein [Spirochaetota bacterium]|nr:DUF3343 domain-containing protein [Spirochaetota bacterium]
MKEKILYFINRFIGNIKKETDVDRGLILFEETSEAIRAETSLIKAGYRVRMVAPPYHLRKGCDLSIEFNLMEQLGIERILREAGDNPIDVIPISDDTLKPVEIVKKTDFGKWYMIRAANMKLTFDKKTGEIVNISGGGCPDVPYIASEMMWKTLYDTPRPRDVGHTVCAYALEIAFEEAKKYKEGS